MHVKKAFSLTVLLLLHLQQIAASNHISSNELDDVDLDDTMEMTPGATNHYDAAIHPDKKVNLRGFLRGLGSTDFSWNSANYKSGNSNYGSNSYSHYSNNNGGSSYNSYNSNGNNYNSNSNSNSGYSGYSGYNKYSGSTSSYNRSSSSHGGFLSHVGKIFLYMTVAAAMVAIVFFAFPKFFRRAKRYFSQERATRYQKYRGEQRRSKQKKKKKRSGSSTARTSKIITIEPKPTSKLTIQGRSSSTISENYSSAVQPPRLSIQEKLQVNRDDSRTAPSNEARAKLQERLDKRSVENQRIAASIAMQSKGRSMQANKSHYAPPLHIETSSTWAGDHSHMTRSSSRPKPKVYVME